MTHEHTQRMALAAAVGWALFGAVGCDGDTDDDDTAVDDDNGDDDTATDDDDSVPT